MPTYRITFVIVYKARQQLKENFPQSQLIKLLFKKNPNGLGGVYSITSRVDLMIVEYIICIGCYLMHLRIGQTFLNFNTEQNMCWKTTGRG